MGLVSDQRKFMKARITLSSLKYDLGNITTPSLRKFVLSQILGMETHANQLAVKINIATAGQAQETKPCPEKKTPQPKATTITTKRKTVDNLNRELVK